MSVRAARWAVVALAVVIGLALVPAGASARARVRAHTALTGAKGSKAGARERIRLVRGHAVRKRRPARRRPAKPVTKPRPAPSTTPAPAPASSPSPAPADPNCTGADTVPTAATTGVAAAATLCLVNRERATAGLAPLAANSQLAAAAAGHSADMVAQHYFSHDSLNGRDFMDRIRAAGWTPSGNWTAGENIAWGSGSYGTPRNIVASWMNSPGHRANILNARYRETGVGVAAGAPQSTRSGAGTYTQDFGARG